MPRIIIVLMFFMAGAPAWAADSGIVVSGAWARATAPGQDSGMIQFSITGKENAKLVAAATPAAKAVEIHRMTHENGRMEMRAVESLALPAGKTIDLGKGGYHVMLTGLKQALKAGDKVPLTLTVEFSGGRKVAVEVTAEILAPGMSPGMHDMMDMGDMHGHGS